MSLESALKESVGALEDRLQPEDAALVELAFALARQLDSDDATAQNGAVWREYRAAVQALREAALGGSDDDTTAFIVSVQTPSGRSKVRDKPKP